MEILSLGEKIKKRRKELNMTLKDLAKDRITPGQISLVESGKSNPSMDLLEYLSLRLTIPIEYLIETEESQAEKICSYYEDITDYFIYSHDTQKAEENNETALFYCREYNLEYKKAVNFSKKADILIQKREYSEAQSYYLNANAIFLTFNKTDEVIRTYIKIGEISLNLESYHSAISYIKQGERFYLDGELNDPSLLGCIYYYLAFTYYKLENIEKSTRYSFLAKEKLSQVVDKKRYADNLALLSQQYAYKGDIENAVKYSNETKTILKGIEDLVDLSRFENGLGDLFAKLENYEESFNHLNKAREIRENTRDSKIIETLLLICENYLKIEDRSNAKKILDTIHEYLNESEGLYFEEYYILEFQLNMIEKEYVKAEHSLYLALQIAEENNNLDKISEISIIYGGFYKSRGDDVKASEYLNKGILALKKMGIIKQ